MKTINLILNFIRKTVGVTVAVILGWMVLLGASQLILRWSFGIGIPWADIQLRQMVLIIALMGGVLAAAENRHIRIDLLEHFIKGRIRRVIQRIVLCTAAVCVFFLAIISIFFINSERFAGIILRDFLFGLNIHQWYLELFIPICFSLMGLFFLASAIFPLESGQPEGNID